MKKLLMLVMVVLCFVGRVSADTNNCLEFDGANDRVNIGNDASLDRGNLLSLEVWVRADDLSTRQGIFSTRLDNNAGSFQLEVGPGSGGTNRVAVSGVGTWVAETGDNVITAGEWTHIAYVRSSVSNQVLYVNGVAQSLSLESTSYSFVDTYADKMIASGTGGGQFFDGQIDDLRIWNTARTAEQISDHMHTIFEGYEAGFTAFYRFDETSGTALPDQTANDNDGTLVNMVGDEWTERGATPVAGFGTALEFDGTNDFVDVGTGFALGNTLTIEAWAKCSDLSKRQAIFSTRFGNSSGSFQVEIGPGQGSRRVAVTGSSTWIVQTGDDVITTDEWTHIAYTRNGTGTGTHAIYVNGVAQSPSSENNFDFIDNADMKIIGAGEDLRKAFGGQLDEVRVWDTSLSANTISNWMFRTADVTHPGWANLVASYSFDEDTGTTAVDLTENNNGSLSNMAVSAWVDSKIKNDWTIYEGETLSSRLIGSDVDGASSNGSDWNLSFEIVDPGSLGTAMVTADNLFEYTAQMGVAGQDSFTYRVRDAEGNLSKTHTVSVNVEAFYASISITNLVDSTIGNEVETVDVQGTNNPYVVGTMLWTNAATGANGSFAASAEWQVSGIALNLGDNTITVSGTNRTGVVASDSVTVRRDPLHVGDSPIHYVSTNGLAVWPYTNWIDAATCIQDALDVAASNDTVLVTNGTYDVGGAAGGSRVRVRRAITLESVNGRDNTVIVGGTNIRCVYLNAIGATLDGFTLTNGVVTGERNGGGAYLEDGATINNCTIIDCSANYGGGAYFEVGASTMSNCTVTGCSAVEFGGGCRIREDGVITHCTITGNSAKFGGGLDLSYASLAQYCIISSNSATQCGGGVMLNSSICTLNNSLIVDNSAGVRGGGTYGFANDGFLNNCTISGNSAGDVGGGCTEARSMDNCIVWGNSARSWSDLYSGRNVRNTCASSGVTNGVNGCITSDPLFVDAAGGDYRLMYGSLCINAGANAYSVGDTDFDGNTRILDGTVDMGCYESDTRIHADDSPIHYVSPSGGNVWPYTNWLDAATTIQEAIFAAASNDTVLVTNGVYDTGGVVPHGQDFTNRVVILRDITVESVNGSDHTFIVGASDGGTNGPAAVRCVWMSDGLLSGFTVTNGHTQTEGDWGHYQRGGGVFLHYDGTVSNCVVSDCSANITGGGIDLHYGGHAVDCIIENNSTTAANYGGGGVCLQTGGIIERCTVRNNSSSGLGGDGGGLYFYSGGEARNCLVAGNSADDDGGGVYLRTAATNALVESCTIVDNTATDGGGFYTASSGTVVNCIVYSNNASSEANCFAGSADIRSTCSDPLIAGINNISADPQFIGDWQLQGTSPCINTGSNQTWMADGVDRLGNVRIFEGTVDMGCTEGAAMYAGSSPIHYVSPVGGSVWPYTDWTNAATNIQDAVFAAASGDTVLVTNGIYDVGGEVRECRVQITRATTVRSVNGPDDTVIVGGTDIRGAILSGSGALLSGFTITNATVTGSRNGGGLWLEPGTTASNCIITDCEAPGDDGGGAFFNYGGTLTHSTLTGNSAEFGGGATCYGGTLTHCTLSGNTAGTGGGVNCRHGAMVLNCTISNNESDNSGGVSLNEDDTVRNCLIVSNSAEWGGGVECNENGILENCTLADNSASSNGGGVILVGDDTLKNCILWGNTPNDILDIDSDAILNTCASDGLTHGTDGCITNNPQFAGSGDYRISVASPSIDAGVNVAGIDADIDGTARPLDGDNNGSAITDMGCYEHLNRAADSDGDTMTDGWETDNGLNLALNDATANPDDDSFDNREEYIADTDPADPSDAFRLSDIDGTTVEFISSSNRLYTLLGCTNLLSNDWEPVQAARMGTGGADFLQSTNDFQQEFYKLTVELP